MKPNYFKVIFCFKLYFTKLSNVWKSGTKFQIQIVILVGILTRLLLQFEPYFEPKWPNSAKMKKAKLAFWPTFSFLLRSLFLLFLWSRAAVDFKTWFGLLLLFFTNATKQRWSLGGLGSGGGAAALAKLTGRLLLREHKVHDFPLNFRLLPYRWQISFRNIICAPFCAPFLRKNFTLHF